MVFLTKSTQNFLGGAHSPLARSFPSGERIYWVAVRWNSTNSYVPLPFLPTPNPPRRLRHLNPSRFKILGTPLAECVADIRISM